MKACKWGVLVGGLLGVLAAFLPLSNGGDGSITFWTLQHDDLRGFVAWLAFVPFLAMVVTAAVGIRTGRFDGFLSTICAAMSLLGFVMLTVGLLVFGLGQRLDDKHNGLISTHAKLLDFGYWIAIGGLLIAGVFAAIGSFAPERRPTDRDRDEGALGRFLILR